MKPKVYFKVGSIVIFLIYFIQVVSHTKMYFSTSADSQYFHNAVNLIKTIHKHNSSSVEAIAVFDLGLDPEQRDFLNSMKNTKVYDLEIVHPDLLKHFVVRANGKKARGWYAWKPVILKQSLDLFPYVLYIDAGSAVVGSLTPLFENIQMYGYFFTVADATIRSRATQRVVNFFKEFNENIEYILNLPGIAAGLQGVSRKVYQKYVLPLYELAKNIEYFEDDGTAPYGWGEARHDQSIASLYVRILGYKIHGGIPGCTPYLQSNRGSFVFDLNNYVVFWVHTEPVNIASSQKKNKKKIKRLNTKQKIYAQSL
jgi:hypothetical protein